MNRLKTFDSTGLAPNGILYSGDLNALQDAVAAISDFSQTISTGSLAVGDSSIQLLKYGTAEARISAALRTDGIFRGLGGLYAGAFGDSGLPASGHRPFGLAILNTTRNRLEWNSNTDPSPVWKGIAEDSSGYINVSTGFKIAGTILNSAQLSDSAALARLASPVFSGNVGIGVSPVAHTKLAIQGDGSGWPTSSGTTLGNGTIARIQDLTAAALQIGGYAANGFWIEATNTADLSIAYPIVFQPNHGNIGIGNNATSGLTPIYHFTVVDPVVGHRLFGIDTSGTSTGGTGSLGTLRFPGINLNGPTMYVYADAPGSSYGNQRLTITSLDGSGASLDTMHFKDGKVGIGAGVVSPNAALDVNGDIITEGGFIWFDQPKAGPYLHSDGFSVFTQGLIAAGEGYSGAGTMGGLVTSSKAGIPADADFQAVYDGLMCVDIANSRLYVRANGVWLYATLQ